jgi:hypothetical protein
VVGLLATFTLMTTVTERLKVVVVQRLTTVLDGKYVVDHLRRPKAPDAYGIPSNKPAS